MTEPFSVRIRRMHTERHMSEQQLADAAGVSQRAIYSYENGHQCPKMSSIIGLREALGCTWDDLLEGIVR